MAGLPDYSPTVEIYITIEICDGCELCVDFCPVKVLRIQDGIPIVDKLYACYACNTCEDLCPHGAITIKPNPDKPDSF